MIWFVTGATGHIGNVLVRKLIERGDEVRVLTLPNECLTPIAGLQVVPFEGNILDLRSLCESMRGVRGIFHLAGVISIMPGTDELVRRVNVEGTRNILRAAAELQVPKLVYTSSIHAI